MPCAPSDNIGLLHCRGSSLSVLHLSCYSSRYLPLLWHMGTYEPSCLASSHRSNCLTLVTCAHHRYLDDMMSGWEISDSTFINVKGLAFELGGGRHNRVLRNRLRNVSGVKFLGSGVSLDARGLGLGTTGCGDLAKRVTELLYPGSLWGVRWPELRNETTDNPCAPVYCDISDNTYDANTCPTTSCQGGFLASPALGKEVEWHFTHVNNTRVVYQCSDALVDLCGTCRGTHECAICAGRQQSTLRQAGCSHAEIKNWCAGVPSETSKVPR